MNKLARDPRFPVDHHLRVAQSYEARVSGLGQSDNPGLLAMASKDCLIAGYAFYSAGEPISKVVDWLSKALDYELRGHAAKQYTAAGPGGLAARMEICAASYLAGRLPELLKSLERFRYSEPLPEWQAILTLRLEKFWTNRPQQRSFDPEPAAFRRVQGAVALAGLLDAVLDNDRDRFPTALAEFLRKVWAVEVRDTVPQGDPIWSGFAAVTCERMGFVPRLSASMAKYIPVDLIPVLQNRRRGG